MSHSVLIVAAEASSALYAQRLMEEWARRGKDIKCFGIGNQAMVDLGFEALGRSEQLAVVGVKEVIAHYSEIKKVFYSLIEACEKRKPDVILLLDYPDFNLRLAKKLKKFDIPIVYYISPQLWAWRKGRIHLMKTLISKILVLLPFEKPFYEKNGVDVDFVGHPLLDELSLFKEGQWDRELWRSRQGVSKDDFLLGLMPGSRKSEVGFHLETQIKAAQILTEKYPFIKVSILVSKNLDMQSLKHQIPNVQFPIQLMQDSPEKMIDMCDFVIAKSGTGTLIVTLLHKPSIIMYKVSAISAWIAKNFIKGVKYFGLTNLILDKALVPEYFQEQANPEALAAKVSEYIDNPELMKNYINELKTVEEKLGLRGATQRVADALEVYL